MIEDDHDREEDVSDEEHIDRQDENEDESQVEEDEEPEQHDDESDPDVEETDEEPAPAPVATSRGRPRGRGRGLTRGRPRGRGRGGRGIGSRGGRGGRKSGIIVIRNPNFAAAQTPDDSGREGDSSPAGTPAMDVDEDVTEDAPEAKWFREIDGVRYETDGEELSLPSDANGDTKIDSLGNLTGGRKFKGSTFTSAIRPNPQKRYILSIEAARATGYRDSLYYFRRNPLLVKITLTQSEKEILIADKILSQNLRSRIVTMVTARTAFMMGGAKLVRDGKWVDDDYYEDKAREDCIAKGFKPGDPIGEVGDNTFDDPNRAAKLASAAAAAAAQSQNQSQASDRASAVYKTGGATTFFGGAGIGPFAGEMPSSRKAALSRDGVTEENWIALMAQKVVEANEGFAKMRKERLQAFGSSGSGPPTAVAPTQSLRTAAATLIADVASPRGTPGPSTPAPEPAPVALAPPPISTEGLSQSALRALNLSARQNGGAAAQRKPKRLKGATVLDEHPKGVYEPHTGLNHYRQDTQPTRSRMERVYGPEADEKSVLGGTMTGSGAWGLVWIDSYAEGRDYAAEKELEMRKLYEELTS